MKLLPWFLLPLTLALPVAVLLACRPAASTRPGAELIRFERTACYGPCPVDVLSIETNGSMRYIGREHGPRTGLFRGQLTPAERTALVRAFEAARFFEFAPSYTSRATDLPTYYLTFSQGGRTHKVTDYDGGPAALKALEKRLESLIDAPRWRPQPAR